MQRRDAVDQRTKARVEAWVRAKGHAKVAHQSIVSKGLAAFTHPRIRLTPEARTAAAAAAAAAPETWGYLDQYGVRRPTYRDMEAYLRAAGAIDHTAEWLKDHPAQPVGVYEIMRAREQRGHV